VEDDEGHLPDLRDKQPCKVALPNLLGCFRDADKSADYIFTRASFVRTGDGEQSLC